MPRKESHSDPGLELLGVVTSHGPSRESYTPFRKSSEWPAEASDAPAADAPVSPQRLRAAFSSAASAAAVLQRAMPEGGSEVVAVEGAATIPGDNGGQTETARPKPALPGAGPQRETIRARGSWRGREGNH